MYSYNYIIVYVYIYMCTSKMIKCLLFHISFKVKKYKIYKYHNPLVITFTICTFSVKMLCLSLMDTLRTCLLFCPTNGVYIK